MRAIVLVDHGSRAADANAQLEEITARYAEIGLTSESAVKLRAELTDLGLDHVFPETLGRIVDEQE